jgi:hypothetical protein
MLPRATVTRSIAAQSGAWPMAERQSGNGRASAAAHSTSTSGCRALAVAAGDGVDRVRAPLDARQAHDPSAAGIGIGVRAGAGALHFLEQEDVAGREFQCAPVGIPGPAVEERCPGGARFEAAIAAPPGIERDLVMRLAED